MTEEKKSLWSGLSGGLAAATALITAVGALLAVLVQVGGRAGRTRTPSSRGRDNARRSVLAADGANEICERATS